MSVEPVTDAEIAQAFDGKNFGMWGEPEHRRPYLANSVLKVALGYHCGGTITDMMLRMGLVRQKGKIRDHRQRLKVTERGRVFCYAETGLERAG